MQFKSPFTDEDTAKETGRQALGPLIDAIRGTVADMLKDLGAGMARLLMLSCDPSEIDAIARIQWEHAKLLVNIVLSLDEHRLYRGHQAVEDWLTGGHDE